MNEFFSMGGYAGYIWPAYAIPAVLMVVIWLLSQKGLADSWRLLTALEEDLATARKAPDAKQSEGEP